MSGTKTYLNKAQKEDTCILSLIAEQGQYALDTWGKDMTKEERKYLKTSITYALKWLDSIMNRIGKDLAEQLVRLLKTSEIILLPKYEAQKEWNRRKEMFKAIEVDRDTLLDMAEHALIGCENCNKDYTKCRLRETFVELGIEPFDYYAVNKCQYRVEKEE